MDRFEALLEGEIVTFADLLQREKNEHSEKLSELSTYSRPFAVFPSVADDQRTFHKASKGKAFGEDLIVDEVQHVCNQQMADAYHPLQTK